MSTLKSFILALPLVILITGCNNKEKITYEQEIADWKASRLERLKGKNGWLNLAGLYWLSEAENTIGSDSTNSIIFPPPASAFYGSIRLAGDSMLFKAALGAEVLVDGKLTSEKYLLCDASGKPSIMEAGNMAWYIIRRDNKYGIRLRNYDHPRISGLAEIPAYKPDLKWKIIADYIPYDTVREIETATVTGGLELSKCPGELIFTKGIRKYKLHPFSEGKELFIIFADKTNGIETYGNGRYMYASLPDSLGKVVLDFNKAYNPPCAFSPFATCPMPPRENILDLKVDAGEKEVHFNTASAN